MPRPFRNLQNQTFEYLTAIEFAGYLPISKTARAAHWKCHCKCGAEVIVPSNNLLRKNTTSCGCRHSEIVRQIKVDLTGQTFNDVKVIKFIEVRDGNSQWECLCHCGKTFTASGNALQRGLQKSCGCGQGWWRSDAPGLWKTDPAANIRRLRQDPARKIRNSVSNSIRGMIQHHGGYKRKKSIRNYLPYTIEELKAHLESLWEPWMSWENYGGRPNDSRQTWHIDHIIPHSSFPYTSMDDPLFQECWALSNLRPLEKRANMSKGNRLTLD